MANAGTNGANQWNWTALSQRSAQHDAPQSADTRGASQHKKQQYLKPPPSSIAIAKQSRHKPTSISATNSMKTNVTKNEHEDKEAYSGLRIAKRTISALELRTEMSGRKFIPLQRMDMEPKDTFNDNETDWVTIGVLVRKTISKAAANGSTFMVWGLSDLNGTELGVFLFGEAYDAHWKDTEGIVVALLNAALMPATEKNKFAFKTTQASEIVKLGTAVDFGICKGMTSGEARCRLAVNTAVSQYCLHHIATNFVQASRGRQQLNNAIGSFRKALFAGVNQPKNISAGVYTSSSSSSSSTVSSGWKPIFSKKRKRADGSDIGLLGVPTVLSASGAVVQKALCPVGPGVNHRNLLAPMSSRQMVPPNSGSIRPNNGQAGLNSKPVTRGQKIISSMIAASESVGSSTLKQQKRKKVDMIRFMNTGSQS